jgi:Transglutaminase-like superfamily/IPT/TIG domain
MSSLHNDPFSDIHGPSDVVDVDAAGQAGGNGQGETDGQKPHQRLLKSKGFIPTLVVVGLVLFVLLSSRLVGRPPQIDSITPTSGKPGDVMIITGRYFGSSRTTSEVRISGVSPTSSDYVEWTDTRISVTIPDEATSGIVYVITRNGRSGGLLFINRDQIPVLASGPAKPGEPYVSSIQPMAAEVGDTITISGMNFGLEKGQSEVYFTWGAGSAASTSAGIDLVDMLPARDYNMDYISWSDREIVLRVPDGAASGNVLVTSDKGQSNSVYFEVLAGAGTKLFSLARKYSVQYGMNVAVNAASGDNTLYLWMPHVIPTPEQRRVQLVSQDPEPMIESSGPALYALTNLQKGARHHIGLSWMFDRYAVETQVNPAKVPLSYDTTSDMYRHFTSADVLVPSTNPEIVKAAAAVVRSEKNPYLKAHRLYEWMVSTLSFAQTSQEGDPLVLLKSKKGDAFAWSALYCSLLRSAGIPSRMVAGYLAGADAGQPARRHFWDEFYIESLGWVPVDALLATQKPDAAGQGAGFDPKEYFFGNLDNRHITLTKGLEAVNQMDPQGRTVLHRELPYLLTIHEEAVGNITSYTSSFEDMVVSGTY